MEIGKKLWLTKYSVIINILYEYYRHIVVVYNLHYDRDFFFHAINMNMNGMVMTDVAIITGCIISMSTGMPEAIR